MTTATLCDEMPFVGGNCLPCLGISALNIRRFEGHQPRQSYPHPCEKKPPERTGSEDTVLIAESLRTTRTSVTRTSTCKDSTKTGHIVLTNIDIPKKYPYLFYIYRTLSHVAVNSLKNMETFVDIVGYIGIVAPFNLIMNAIPDLESAKLKNQVSSHNYASSVLECRNRVIAVLGKKLQKLSPAIYSSLNANSIPRIICDKVSLYQKFHVYMDMSCSEPLSFSFGSSGALGVFYQLGVAQCLYEIMDKKVLAETQFLGSGTGSLIAAIMAADLQPKNYFEALNKYFHANSGTFGLIGTSGSFLSNILREIKWPAITKFTGRLGISVTEVPSISELLMLPFSGLQLNNYIVSGFEDHHVNLLY